MTLEDVYSRLSSIDSQAQSLMWNTGIAEDSVPWEYIAIDEDDPDDIYLRDTALRLIRPFAKLHEELSYLHLPCIGEHALSLFPGGRYGYHDSIYGSRILSCGSCVEALVPDEHGCPHWVRSRIEHNGMDYYLYGFDTIPLDGLIVREREEMP